jgi:hypothetical protein
MEQDLILGFKELRRKIWEGMSITELYQVKNSRLEMLDSGMHIDKKDLEEINRELRKRGENV